MPTKAYINNHESHNGLPMLPGEAMPQPEEVWMGMLSRRPPWMVRWGISVFLLLVTGLLGITSFIRYPDRVTTQGRLRATFPPQPLVVRSEGRLQHLIKADGDSLIVSTLVAVLETTANYTQVLHQKAMADSLLILVSTAQSDRVPGFFRKINSDFPLPVLGELQNSYQTYFAALQTYTQYLGNGYYVAQRQMLRSDLQNINAQEQVIAEQLNLTKLDVSLSGENFNVSESLLKQQVIAPVEYRNEAGKWLGKQMQIPQLKNIQLANTAQRLEKRKQMAALENDIALQRGIFVQALQNWLSAIAAWEQQYLVYASCSGTLVLSSFYNPGRNLQRGEILGSVQPTNSYYFLEATLPQFNFGKLKSGQQALVRFAAYPSEEFGTVAARLDVIKPIPTDSGYLARVLLTAGLVTHLGKELAYREGLQASIEIYTDNRSMLERLLSGLTKAVQR